MYVSHAAAAGFLLALLALRMGALSAPQNLPGGPSGLSRELSALLAAAAGPGSGSSRGGSRQQRPHRGKASSSSSSRLLRDLRTDAKQARLRWSRQEDTDAQTGGTGGSRRGKGKGKGKGQGCFGLPLDRIGTHSGLGC